MTDNNNFFLNLIKCVIDSMYNNYSYNYSVHRFGKENNKDTIIKKIFKNMGYVKRENVNEIQKKLSKSKSLIINAGYLFNLLDDEISKILLVKVVAYRFLGYKKIKLPMNNGNYFKSIKAIEKNLKDKNNFIDSGFNNWKLFLHDVNAYGFFCKLYYTSSGIFHRFVYRSYEYKPKNIKAEKGDIVIDAGACWGDTALYFAHLVGETGHVYSFEFLQKNLEIFNKNISLNPDLADRISLINSPLWDKSNVDIFCNNNGPGNSVNIANNYNSMPYKTISIDDFVSQKKIEKINFIKMDIEGAELEALKGAENAIRKWRPKMAISVYHKESDFKLIPDYINSLDLGYKFYFDHYSIHHEESVLFAVV